MPGTKNSKKKVYDAIWRKLILGELQPGARLSETALAKEFGVSRTPVREALNQLSRDGLVDSIPNTGSYVRKLDPDEIAELLDLRELLEIYAIRRAARIISESQLDEMRKTCQVMGSVRDEVVGRNIKELEGALAMRWRVSEVAFHASLVDNSSAKQVSPISRLARDFHILLNLCMRLPRDKTITLRERLSRVVKQHESIVDALAERDPEKASARLRDHIREGRRQILQNDDSENTADSSVKRSDASALDKILRY